MHELFRQFLDGLSNDAGTKILVIAGAGWIWISNWWHRRQNHKNLTPEESLDRSRKIQARQNLVRDRVGAQRVYLSQVKNGTYWTDGVGVQSYDRTEESVQEGVAPEAAKWNSIPFSTVPDELALIAQPGPSFTRVEDLPAGRFKWMLNDSNIKCIARCSVMHDGKWWGFLGADWTQDVPKPANIGEFVALAGTIDQLMGVS